MTTMTPTRTWQAGDTCRFIDPHDGKEHSGTILYISQGCDGWPDMAAIDDACSHAQVYKYVNHIW